jgi:multidrug resistance efflux pump
MPAEIIDSPLTASSPEVSFMEPIRPSTASRRPRRASFAVWLGALIFVASLVVAGLSMHGRSTDPTLPPSTAPTPTEGQAWYSLGKVDIEGGITPLYPLQLGRVAAVEARENEPVKAGQPLVRLEGAVQRLKQRQAEMDLQGAQRELAIAQAKVKEADSGIAAQKLAIDAASKNVEKARILQKKQKDFEEGGLAGDKETLKVANLTVEQAELAVQGERMKLTLVESAKFTAEQYVAAARAKIEAKQAQLDEAKKAVEDCVLRAPVDGTSLRILVTPGQALGANPRQPAVVFAADRPLLVRAEVEQEFVDRVHESQRVVIEDHVTGKECGQGKVISLARWFAPSRTNNPETLQLNNDARTLECVVQIESKTREMRIGQRVRVRFVN